MAIQDKLKQVLDGLFKGDSVEVDDPLPNGNVFAFIVSDRFHGMTRDAREALVRKLIAPELTRTERRKVSIIFARTPDEIAELMRVPDYGIDGESDGTVDIKGKLRQLLDSNAEVVQPDDPRRLPDGHELAGDAGEFERAGAVHLF